MRSVVDLQGEEILELLGICLQLLYYSKRQTWDCLFHLKYEGTAVYV